MKSITLKNITHTYGKHTVLHDVTLSLPIGKNDCDMRSKRLWKDNASQYYRLAGASEQGKCAV